MIHRAESSHWYFSNGQPCHTIIGKNGRPRPTNLKDARQFNLYPSVTQVTRMWPADNLRNWILEQHVLAAVTTPRLSGESDGDWINRVLNSADEESEKARTVGSRRHDILHQFHRHSHIKKDTPDWPYVEPYIDWLRQNVSRIEDAEYVTVHRGLGYAGTVDLRCTLNDGRSAILDIKNRKTIKVWETDIHQLVAYAKAEQHSGRGVDAVISIVLGSESPELFVAEHIGVERAWEDFLLCLRLYQRSRNYTPKLSDEKEGTPMRSRTQCGNQNIPGASGDITPEASDCSSDCG